MSLPYSLPRPSPYTTPVLSTRAFMYQSRAQREPEQERRAKERLVANNLDHANHMLSEANRIIAEQEARIRKLEGMTHTDELTGLMNRRGLTVALNHQLALIRRTHVESAFFILFEADGYSSVLEEHGKAVGEAYLQTMASVFINTVRTMDIAAYLGHGRFALLMPRIDARQAAKRLDVLKTAFHARVMHHNQLSLRLSGHFGYAMVMETETVESLFVTADTKLYSEKAHKAGGGFIKGD